ncbi:HAD-IB family phosphatase [Sphingorhabdus sp.]|jgi:HAD superfamily phosphoserine phosphatase-like hydrolase|uniref:HAD-IB family phosphatase n=1 Tax=Sphingorhabdus sp. TaxID=1902408 RepID=UPI0037C97BE8
MNIAIYDLDKTITSRPTFTHFLIFYAQHASPIRLVGLPLWILALIGYRIGLCGRKPLKQFGIQLFIGRKIGADTLTRVVGKFADNVASRGLQPGAVAQLRVDRDRGAFLVLATAASEFYAQAIADLLGFQAVIATRHIMTAHGQITNRILGDNCYADEKLRRIEGWLAQCSIDRKAAHIVFYSDDISDSPTLNFADQAYAVNPSKNFAAAAAKANWGVMDFRSAGDVAQT